MADIVKENDTTNLNDASPSLNRYDRKAREFAKRRESIKIKNNRPPAKAKIQKFNEFVQDPENWML